MGESPDAAACGSLIAACSQGLAWQVTLELLQAAATLPRSCLDERPMADTVMYNDTMSAAMKSRRWQLVLALFSQQNASASKRSLFAAHRPNVGSYSIALKACEQGRLWDYGVHLLQDMCAANLQPNVVTYNTYISLCAQVLRWRDAMASFDRMQGERLRPSVVSYGALITACGKGDRPEKALRLLKEMGEQRLEVSVPAVSAAISACERGHLWQDAVQLYASLQTDQRLPDITVFNATISACEKGAKWEEALCFLQALDAGAKDCPRPVTITYNAVISACGKASRWDLSLRFLAHLCGEASYPKPDGITFNAAINACALSAEWQHALGLFASMQTYQIQPDVISCNSLLAALAQGPWQNSLDLLQQMPALVVEPDQLTFREALITCASASEWQHALQLQENMRHNSTQADIASYSVLLMECQQRDLPNEMDLLQSLPALAEGGHNGEEVEKFWLAAQDVAIATRRHQGHSPAPELLRLSEAARQFQGSLSGLYGKELELLRHVILNAQPNDLVSICAAMENFGTDVLQGEHVNGRWLKLAAGEKAEVLASAMKSSPNRTVLELGTYCGYSAMVICQAVADVSITTVENDPVHAIIATNILAFAGVSQKVKVLIGHSLSLLPRLAANMNERFGGVFTDTRGSRYDQELMMLIQHGLLEPKAVIVADNVLKPGTPLYLWLITRDARFKTEIYPVGEFAMPAKDWMSVSIYDPEAAAASGEQPLPSPPAELLRLHAAADEMRTRVKP